MFRSLRLVNPRVLAGRRLLSTSLTSATAKAEPPIPSKPNSGKWLASARASNKQPTLLQNIFGTKHLGPFTGTQQRSSNVNIAWSHVAMATPNASAAGQYVIKVTVQTKDPPVLKPLALVCAVDVSSSMSEAATHSSSTDVESSKYSRLDLVQHSLRMATRAMRPIDSLSLVGFSGRASLLLPLTNMDTNGKRTAEQAIDQLNPNGNTNLWDGLSMSLDVVREQQQKGVLTAGTNMSSVLLTDGESNCDPAGGIYPELLRKLDSFKGRAPALHTFSYGYEADSELMSRIAARGGGLFGHIPDHTMCGTVFTHFLANSLAASANQIIVTPISRSRKTRIRAEGAITPALPGESAESPIIRLGGLQWDQPREFFLYVDGVHDPASCQIDLQAMVDGVSSTFAIDGLNIVESDQPLTALQFTYGTLLEMTLATLGKGVQQQDLSKTFGELKQINDMALKVAPSSGPLTAQMFALAKNIYSADPNAGQLMKAFETREWFTRWGLPYVRGFSRGHQLGNRTNYKDPSLQFYGGPLFAEVLQEIEEIYKQMPIPKPSRSYTPFQGNFQQSFYSSTGPCFDGDGHVQLANGSTKTVKELCKGDILINSDGERDTIQCVIKTTTKDGYSWMLKREKMMVTAWHPIRTKKTSGPDRTQDVWEFPANIGQVEWLACPYVYNFVLSSSHIITINGVDGITFGHGFTHSILKHPFLGTTKVLDHLRTHPGWNDGLIHIVSYQPSWDKEQNLASFF